MKRATSRGKWQSGGEGLEAPAAPRRSAATKSSEVKDAMGDWLGELALWDVFATWTFAKPVSAAGAMHMVRRYLGIIPKQRIMTRVMIQPEGKPEFFWGADVSCGEIQALQAADVPISIPQSGDTWLSLPDMGCRGLYGFVAAEKGRRGGLIHLHALLGNTGGLQANCEHQTSLDQEEEEGSLGKLDRQWGKDCCLRHSWPRGYARVLPYDPKLAATHYVSKYIVKGLAEWELFGPLAQV